MFRLYYLGLADYNRARHFLGLSERGWVNWSEEIRPRCGEELLPRGMFPLRGISADRSTVWTLLFINSFAVPLQTVNTPSIDDGDLSLRPG
jgi:hypothetical protein